jgi:adenine deaminase
MMNYPGIVGCDPDVLRKLTATSNIDGHAPMITGDGLNAYISAGIRTDHESVTIDEAREKLAKGMYILIREGSNARELAEMVPLINKDFISRIAFCTDDKDMHDINYEGTIDFSINKAIKLGADPVLAITAASYSACSIYGLAHKGAIAPGYKADIVLTDGLNAENILQVYKNGTLIAENGKALFRCEKANTRHVTSTVHIRPLKASDLELEFSPDLTVIQAHKDTLVTSGIHCDTDEGLNTACIIERHKATGRIGKAFVSGFGIQHGAVAQTIGHDSHNICVVGDNAGDMLMAVEALGKDGGIAVVANGEVEAQLSLPVAGLMSDQTMTDALPKFEKVTAALAEISKGAENSLFMSMSFLSLIVIPDVKLTDKGVFDVKEWKFIS